MNKVWDTCPYMMQPFVIFGGKVVVHVRFTHGIRLWLPMPFILTRVYKIPKLPKSFNLPITNPKSFHLLPSPAPLSPRLMFGFSIGS
ncbi:hypothetical protein Hanom_Chr15g01414841 [Helianthus anomalus]